MDIQNPLRKLLHEPRRKQPHISGKADQVHPMLLQRGDDFAIVLLAWLALGRNHQRIQPALAGGRDSRRVGLVGDHNRDPRIRNAARINAVCDRDEIRPASGKKNAKGFHGKGYQPSALSFSRTIIIHRRRTDRRGRAKDPRDSRSSR